MGRKAKMGLDYFQADVDMFQDRKIRRLLRAVGGNGFTIYIYLLTEIYRDQGYYYAWDEHSAFDISDDLNLTEGLVEEAVKACCALGLFNKSLFAEESVLSSESIQQRWQSIVKEANRTITYIDPRYEIINGKPAFLREKTLFPPEEMKKPHEETTQRKGKESKVKKNSPSPRAKRSPGNRVNAKGKSTLSGWEKHNDDIPLCFADVAQWLNEKNLDIPPDEFEDELERFRDRLGHKRYKDWVAALRNYLRARYLEPEHFDYKLKPSRNGTYSNRKSRGDRQIEQLQAAYSVGF